MENRIRCTFPKGKVEKENWNPRTPKCDCKHFKVMYNPETFIVSIICKDNKEHILTTYTLNMMEVGKDGILNPVNNDSVDSNDNPNNSGIIATERRQETDQSDDDNNEPD
jgi:hypothetical protein